MPPSTTKPASRILIVDDDVSVTDTFSRMLRLEGYEVWAALSADEGLTLAQTHRPHAVILDLLMPRMNGFEAIPVLREECPEVAIVAYSAVAGDFARKEMGRWDVPLRLKNGDAEPLVQVIRELAAARLR